ncbi:carbohydrate kinase family protein [Anaerocolumna xylanovorans]|uniref:Sugar or nucleoside kinase, ribokinase family n=1 Tax=Anaerocolumna xylanovorans DSM 12503 TaxID=1121345 RepID=A0A1M7Y547_9FIRM|nr:carbohydrate kinase family protein [Anaerocolumna xylanovorans]SHO47518.1 Sugar or nucleoside kinase, ribokinase family [Anaerocolumna xylanovorans DSM 12503]
MVKFDLVGMDSPCVDLAVNVDKIPEPNHGELVKNVSWQGGGKVATGLIAAARLGARAAAIGNIGTDIYGTFIRTDFIRHGIDTKYLLQREDKSTHFDIVISDKKTGGRNILYYPGTSESITEEELPLSYLQSTKYFYIARLDEITIKAARLAKQAGAKIIMDADSGLPNLKEELPLIDVFIGSEFIYHSLFSDSDYEKNCRAMMEKGPEIVVFTFGEKGAAGVSREGYFQIPAYKVETVDTVGAGDVFHGAFAAGLLKNLSVCETARFAAAAAAIKCTRIGGRAGIPDMDTVKKFMETGMIDYKEIDHRVEFYQRGIEHV